MFSLHYVSNITSTTDDDIEVYSIYHNTNKKFLSFATLRINRTRETVCLSNFDELPIDLREKLIMLIKDSKDELNINHYKVSPFYSGYAIYVSLYDSDYI